MKNPSLVTIGTMSAFLAAVPAYAGGDIFAPATLPAVSGLNWKAAIAGGFADIENQNADGLGLGALSFTMPLTFSTGLQFDSSAGALGSDFIGSVGGHLFMRNPASYLLGVWGGHAVIDNNDITRVGPELALYFGDITISGVVGWENSDTEGNDVFSHANLALYLGGDNFKIYTGYRRTLERNAGAIGFEWLAPVTQYVFKAPMSLFAEAQFGEDKLATVWAGIRFYFGGPDKSLKRRHREDDPDDPSLGLNQLGEEDQCVPFITPDAVVDSCGNPLAMPGPK